MHYQHPDHTMRNIKRAKTGGFQIQFIRAGKSHSDFSMKLDTAKHRRDAMEKELGQVNQQFRDQPLADKQSVIPGTNQPMPAGISLGYRIRKNGTGQYSMDVHWFKPDKKKCTKHFYAGTDNTYHQGKAEEAYQRAVEFRESWENSMICDELDEFDPNDFNL